MRNCRILVLAAIVVTAGCRGGEEGGKAGAADVAGEAGETLDAEAPPLADLLDADLEEGQDTLVVMTFNVLCSFCDKDYDPWDDRVGYFGDIFARHDPDLIGLQELFTGEEVEQLLAASPQYEARYFRDDEQPLFKEYADAAIFYRSARFEVVESGFYWLSDTPDEPLSGGWADSNLPRLVAWAHLRQYADGRELYFASTHFDNNSPNQEKSAPLFVERTAQWAAEMPAIVVGDFNSRPDSKAFAILTADLTLPGLPFVDTFDLAESWAVDTNLPTVPDYDVDARIDHIFLAGDASWAVSVWAPDLWVYGSNDLYPSDHFPIVARIAW